MELLLSKIIDHIGDHMPVLSTIDEDCGQLEAYADESRDNYPLTFPAVLLNVDSIDWSNTGGDPNHRAQFGRLTIRVRLLIDCYDDIHYGSNGQKKAAERQALAHQLHATIHGFKPFNEESTEQYYQMTRIRSMYQAGPHNVKVYDQYYTLTVLESTPCQTAKANKPTVKISVSRVSHENQ